jgi:hypothetical protein
VIDAVWTVSVGVLLGAWLALSVLCQLPWKALARIQAWDRFGIVGRWSFFAPLPGTSDYYLLVREHYDQGLTGTWRELVLTGPPRGPWNALWTPDKRNPKALFDLTSALIRQAGSLPEAKEAIAFSVPYLMLLNVASHTTTSPLVRARQFLLMKTEGSEQSPEVIFLSNAHEV